MKTILKGVTPSADDVYEFQYYIIGLCIPRVWIRKLSLNKRKLLVRWLVNFWARANDNNVRTIGRPPWIPKRFIYGKIPRKVW